MGLCFITVFGSRQGLFMSLPLCSLHVILRDDSFEKLCLPLPTKAKVNPEGFFFFLFDLSQKPSPPPHMHTLVEFTEPSAYKDFTSDHTNHQTRNHFCMGKRKTNMVKQPQIEIKQSLLHVKRSHMDIKYQWSGTKKIHILHIFCPAPERLAHSSLSWTTIWEESRHLELSQLAETFPPHRFAGWHQRIACLLQWDTGYFLDLGKMHDCTHEVTP